MSAEYLRETAAMIRETARAATPGPWESYPLPDPGPGRWQMVGIGVPGNDLGHRAETMFREDARHIASWHPDVALAVADLLAVVADRYAELLDTFAPGSRAGEATTRENTLGFTQALAVARAWRGDA